MYKEKVLRIPFFVDGLEKIPSTEKSLFQFFKNGLFINHFEFQTLYNQVNSMNQYK